MQYLEFIFGSFWHFIGVAFLMYIGGYYTVALVAVIAAVLSGGDIKFGDGP